MRPFGNYFCLRKMGACPSVAEARIPLFWLWFLWLFVADLGAAPAERLFFLNNGQVLESCLYKPEGNGPFPTVMFNQPVEKALPAEGPVNPFSRLARFYNSNGYALFVTGRHKVSSSKRGKSKEPEEFDDEKHAQHVEIVSSALAMLKAQSYVDAENIYVTGFSAGATTTLFFAEKPLGVRGYVLFSPAAQIWSKATAMQDVLRLAVANATAPIFLIQPQNDYSLGPMEVLGKELSKKGLPNRSKVFPPHGKNQIEGNQFATASPEVWGPDVLSFFKEITP